MAAQLAGAAETRAAGDADSADILVAAATDEGPARLARRAEGPDAALEAALAPLATAPGDAAAATAAQRAVETALQAAPAALSPTARVGRAAGLTSLALEAFTAAQDCGQGIDRAAYAEARALARRALDLIRSLPGQSVGEMAGELEKLAALLPATPTNPLPATGTVSALVSHALLAASDVAP
jgi:hypothetical protein